jgi:hypothetical protein
MNPTVQQRTFSSVGPKALPALAFEHVKGISCVGVHDHPDENELAAAETAGLVGLVADGGDHLSPKQVHGPNPNQPGMVYSGNGGN